MNPNKKYTGIVETNGEIFDNIIPRIIDDEIFDKALIQWMLIIIEELNIKLKYNIY